MKCKLENTNCYKLYSIFNSIPVFDAVVYPFPFPVSGNSVLAI